jgi:hypothetical protein
MAKDDIKVIDLSTIRMIKTPDTATDLRPLKLKSLNYKGMSFNLRRAIQKAWDKK